MKCLLKKITIDEKQIKEVFKTGEPDLIAFGCPHSSVPELEKTGAPAGWKKGEKGDVDMHLPHHKEQASCIDKAHREKRREGFLRYLYGSVACK